MSKTVSTRWIQVQDDGDSTDGTRWINVPSLDVYETADNDFKALINKIDEWVATVKFADDMLGLLSILDPVGAAELKRQRAAHNATQRYLDTRRTSRRRR